MPALTWGCLDASHLKETIGMIRVAVLKEFGDMLDCDGDVSKRRVWTEPTRRV